MNHINIRTGKPDPNYNTVFTFSAAMLTEYMPLRKHFEEELKAGVESFDGTEYCWKMNLSNTKIDIVIGALKKVFQEMETPNGFTEEIIPGQPSA